jgi:hypothetical protein
LSPAPSPGSREGWDLRNSGPFGRAIGQLIWCAIGVVGHVLSVLPFGEVEDRERLRAYLRTRPWWIDEITIETTNTVE